MSGKIMTGARALVYITTVDGTKELCGVFTSVSGGLSFSAPGAWTLGAFGPQETTYTDQDVVSLNCGGWRVPDFGPHSVKAGLVPKLQDLLLHEYMTLDVLDRKTDKILMQVLKVRPLGYTTGFTARAQSELGIPMVGLRISDEAGEHAESGPFNPFV